MSEIKIADIADIADIVEYLKMAKKNGRKCSLLIGAGCSFTAGIPLAEGFVKKIKEDYPQTYKNATEKTYTGCMDKFMSTERRALLSKYIDKAEMNWAHIGIAQLVKKGYVDRVLTTNFDQLVVKACALVNEFPAVYDFASLKDYKPNMIDGNAVIYLHGQRTGFNLINTGEEAKKISESMKPVFEEASRNRIWIVVGYSGKNDPVFDRICEINCSENRLYWIGYEKTAPSHVKKLLKKGKYAFYVNEKDKYGADEFFIKLLQTLECFPPDFIAKPFSYLETLLKPITDFSPYIDKGKIDVLTETRELIKKEKKDYEKKVKTDEITDKSSAEDIDKVAMQLNAKLVAGKYQEIIDSFEKGRKIPKKLKKIVSCAYLFFGNDLADQAEQKSGTEAYRLYRQAYEKYKRAVELNPDDYATFFNWGTTLFAQAKQKSGDKAYKLYDESCEKYEKAVELNPDYYATFYNWGIALFRQAKQKSGTEADRLYRQACEKYKRAIELNPDYYDTLNNWGIALFRQAEQKSGAEADRLYRQAYEKYAKAVEFNPDDYATFRNWGIALFRQAEQKSGAEAYKLYDESCEKHKRAVELNPDDYDTFDNWGNTLFRQAEQKSGAEAYKLYDESCEKYKRALELNPDDYEAFCNWGLALSAQAETKSGAEADRLYRQAYEKYAKAVEFNPDDYATFHNWGIALFAQATTKSGAEADNLYNQAYKKYEKAVDIKPDDYATFHNWAKTLSAQAETKSGTEADKLREQAKEKHKKMGEL